MYKVYLDEDVLQDSSTFLIDPKLELAENSAGSFSFGMYPEHPLYDAVTPASVIRVVQVLEDGAERWIWSGRMQSPAEDFHLQRTIECEGVLAFLADSIQRPAEYHDISVIDFLSNLLEIHNSQVDDFKKIKRGVVTVTDPNDSLYRYTNYENTLSVIKSKLVDRLGGILRIRHESDGLYLDYLADYPRLSSQEIAFGENLMNLLKESSYGDVATVLIPLGARLEDEEKSPDWPEALEQRITIASVNGGVDYLIDDAAAAESGKIAKVVEWDDVHVPAILKSKAQEYLDVAKYETKTITATAIDLSTAGFDVDDFRFLDRIRICSAPHGVDLVFPLTSMTVYLLAPEKNVYTLGSGAKSYTSTQSRSQIAMEEALASMPSKISEARQKAIENATKILQQWADLGYAVHTENESYYMDSPDKTKAKYILRINPGGIGFSRSGFAGPYVSAWTIDGHFNADFITAGTIRGDRIDIAYRDGILEAAGESMDRKLSDYTRTTDFSVDPGEIKGEITAAKTYADRMMDDKLLDYLPASQTYSRNVVDQKMSETENSISLKVSKDTVNQVSGILGTRKLYTCLTATLTTPAKESFTQGAKTPTASTPYLWGFERIFPDATMSVDDPIRLIGMYGQKGADGISFSGLVSEYARSTSSTTAPTSGWSTSMPDYPANATVSYYLWERQKIAKSDGTNAYTTPTLNSFWRHFSTEWSEIKSESNQIKLEVGKKVGADEIIAKINMSAEQATIQAPKINFNGAVTANEHFKINTDGSFQAKHGKVGDFEIEEGCFFYKDKDETWYESDRLGSGGTSIYMGKHGFGTSQPRGLDVALLAWGRLFFKSKLADGTDRMVSVGGSYNSNVEGKPAQFYVVNAAGTNGSGTYLFDVSSYAATIQSKLISLSGEKTFAQGDFLVVGSKSRVVDTDQFGQIAQFAYETATPFFGDIGRGKIGNDGKAVVFMDPVFAESIDADDIHVFLQAIGQDQVYLTDVQSTHFVAEGIPGTFFSWELKARQKGYSAYRLYADQSESPAEEIGDYDASFLEDLEADFLQEEILF
ncbi:phage tail protein [uncultured Dubosiella sp.]|uniref:phage tail protein n=2 Tax=uncultured Dubosiella sp. TaxID=1937011 RepID=UPI00272ED888|nr:phage tail protein [uncultured Dubosiella sp.]